MNLEEFRAALSAKTDEQLEQFRLDFGDPGGQPRSTRTREHLIDDFVAFYRLFPKHEDRLCLLLGTQTEQEKVNHAAIHGSKAEQEAAKAAELSAKYAKEANEHAEGGNRIAATANRIARRSNIISIVSAILSVVALIVAIIALCR